MPEFVKKPVVIEAKQLTPETHAEVQAWCGGRTYSTPPMRIVSGLEIPTLEGTMLAVYGDYIIKGVKGEFYPCKPDIFEETYESAELPAPTISIRDFVTAAQQFAKRMEPVYAMLKWEWVRSQERYPTADEITNELCRQYEVLLRENLRAISTGGLRVERDEYGTVSIFFEHEVVVMSRNDE